MNAECKHDNTQVVSEELACELCLTCAAVRSVETGGKWVDKNDPLVHQRDGFTRQALYLFHLREAHRMRGTLNVKGRP